MAPLGLKCGTVSDSGLLLGPFRDHFKGLNAVKNKEGGGCLQQG